MRALNSIVYTMLFVATLALSAQPLTSRAQDATPAAVAAAVVSSEVLGRAIPANDPEAGPIMIAPGETVVVRPGDALIESPGGQHEAHNNGNVPIIIYLSALFPAGAPRSVVDSATPTP